MLAKWKLRYNGTIVLGVANKIQKDWELRDVSQRETARCGGGGSETRPYSAEFPGCHAQGGS